jgi:type VI secretion system secreted protein Hcp
MTVHMFVGVDKIAGEWAAKSYENQIELLSWTWGLTQTGSAHVGSVTCTSGVSVGDVCAGAFCDEAVLTVLKTGTKAAPYSKLILQHGLVFSVNSGGVGPEERLIETATFNFKAFKMEYTPQKNGAFEPVVPAGWDIPREQAVMSKS